MIRDENGLLPGYVYASVPSAAWREGLLEVQDEGIDILSGLKAGDSG